MSKQKTKVVEVHQNAQRLAVYNRNIYARVPANWMDADIMKRLNEEPTEVEWEVVARYTTGLTPIETVISEFAPPEVHFDWSKVDRPGQGKHSKGRQPKKSKTRKAK